MRACATCRLLDFLLRGRGLGVGDIGGYRVTKQIYVLLNNADIFAQALQGVFLNGNAVNGKLTVCALIKAGDKVDKCGFSATRG